MSDKLIRRPEVEARTGLARTTIYARMARGEFPAPVKIGARAVAWPESVIDEWIEAQIEAGGQGVNQ